MGFAVLLLFHLGTSDGVKNGTENRRKMDRVQSMMPSNAMRLKLRTYIASNEVISYKYLT